MELSDQPFLFEIAPPSKRCSPEKVKAYFSEIETIFKDFDGITAINIPEIVEENHLGKPLHRNQDTCQFAQTLKERLGRRVFVNKVVVHEKRFKEWLEKALQKYDTDGFIFVGGTYHQIQYPGPSPIEANKIAHAQNCFFGNIVIPERKAEVSKLMAKTKTKARFFTSQIIYDPKPVQTLLLQYDESCKKAAIKPATLFLSFAPVSDKQDFEFMKWLGVRFPRHIEAELLTSPHMGRTSLHIQLRLKEQIEAFIRKNKIDVPLGYNMEQISLHNRDLAIQSVRQLRGKTAG